jgi:HD superfamily phosphodiesterase
MEIKNLPEKYQAIWEKSLPLLKVGRPGDDEHAKEVAELILNYQGKLVLDKDILLPVAIMHDIGHAAILPEHFKYITGPEKIENGKLVHMLAGAKIAQDILQSLDYNPEKISEIVEIISMHDSDQLKGADVAKIYDTENKKIFHDIDSFDRYNERRIKSFANIYKDRSELVAMLNQLSDNFFYDEFKKIAKEKIKELI